MVEESNGRPRWQPGEVAVLRYITTRDGLVGATWPCRVVVDRDDLVALYVAEGTMYKFEQRVRAGIYSAALRDAVHAEAERVIAAIESNDTPFCDGWARWAPERAWELPQLPANWEGVPVRPWAGRRRAYPQCQEAVGEAP